MKHARILRIAILAAAIPAAALAGLYAWLGPAAIAPTAGPPPLASPQVLAAGARVVALGDCMVCHTTTTGPAYAGGLGLRTPFGTIYSTNITPDPDTGIGRWSPQAFTRAMREGVSRDGHLLYPAFPYIHYRRMSDQDIELAYRFLMSRTPVRVAQPDNDLPLPLKFRPMLAFWNMLYLDSGKNALPPAPPGPGERGRYLVDTLGHCASCHSGLTLLGGERHPPLQGGDIDGWNAPPLTRLAQGAAPWRQEELVEYLRGGLSLAHGAAKGPMRPVTERLAEVPREDVDAMASYLMSIQAIPAPAPAAVRTAAAPALAPEPTATDGSAGARLFAAACASCHAASAPMMQLGARPGLARSSALLGPEPTNFIQTVLHGIPWEGRSRVYMPPFADTLSDEQVAALAAYVRTAAGQPAWKDVSGKSAQLREEAHP
jgi:mono/diheme cytochrome c family protein